MTSRWISHLAPRGHGLLLIACCVPVVVVVALLVATGVTGAGAVLVGFGCVAMMTAMMVMMPGGHDHR